MMADEIVMRVEGLNELKRRFDALSQDMQRNVARAAVAASGKVIADEVRARAPVAEKAYWRRRGLKVQGGTLQRAIAYGRSRIESKFGVEVGRVFIRHGKRAAERGMDAFYAAWVEFGHYVIPPKSFGGSLRQRRKVKALGSAKFVPAHPFMRPAFAAARERALEAQIARLKMRLDKAGV